MPELFLTLFMRTSDDISYTSLIQSLANQGIEVIFSLSGNQIMPLYDACIDVNIQIIHTRHEGAAVYMAEAYAQMTGKIGVALV